MSRIGEKLHAVCHAQHGVAPCARHSPIARKATWLELIVRIYETLRLLCLMWNDGDAQVGEGDGGELVWVTDWDRAAQPVPYMAPCA